MTTNEAAERLRPGDSYCDRHPRCEGLDPFRHPNQRRWTVEDDRVAERAAGRAEAHAELFAADHHQAIEQAARRATVERIRDRLYGMGWNLDRDPTALAEDVKRILAEEAAR